MSTANAADATLNVVHGIPGVDVNVCVNDSEAISDFSFGDVVTGVRSRRAVTPSRSSQRPTPAPPPGSWSPSTLR